MINKISIIGLGLIGGSIAKSLKNTNPDFYISAYDKSEVLEKALSDKTIDHKLESPEQSLQSDLIFLCLPVDESLKTFEDLIPKLREDQIITDVCGVKSIFQDLWNRSDSKGIYIGGHPMTGKESSGYKNSDPTLFENSVYILTDSESKNQKINPLIEIISKLGARVTFLNPKVHDIVIASVSHLPQLIAVSLINSASLKENDINFFDFAAGGFRDMTRIASSDFEIWNPVLHHNSKNIIYAMDNFINDLQNMKKLITSGKSDSVLEYFESARIKRDEIPRNSKGFITSLFDLFVYVKDEPGILAKLTSILYTNEINIKDIELLKVREGSGGTFRISFESLEVSEKAKKILADSGYKVN
ncbi:MAG: prephenate dehydrogenase [Melioribacteraceae bacterium]|nr:prephenate dehydrogenase [Melioribacteraceae bacterium]